MGIKVTDAEIVLLTICGLITGTLAFFKFLEVWRSKQSKVHAMSRQQILEAMSGGDCGRGHKLYLCDDYDSSATEVHPDKDSLHRDGHSKWVCFVCGHFADPSEDERWNCRQCNVNVCCDCRGGLFNQYHSNDTGEHMQMHVVTVGPSSSQTKNLQLPIAMKVLSEPVNRSCSRMAFTVGVAGHTLTVERVASKAGSSESDTFALVEKPGGDEDVQSGWRASLQLLAMVAAGRRLLYRRWQWYSTHYTGPLEFRDGGELFVEDKDTNKRQLSLSWNRYGDNIQIRWGMKGVHIMQMSKTGRALTGYRMTDRDHCTAHAHGYDVAVMEAETDEEGDMTVIEMVTDVEEIGKVDIVSEFENDSKEPDRDMKRPGELKNGPAQAW